jgi:hypothetical protein
LDAEIAALDPERAPRPAFEGELLYPKSKVSS